MDNKPLTLYQLLNQVKSGLKQVLPASWWVIAEINEIKVNYSGHCYLELIEKDDVNESIKAKVRATIWASVFRMLQPYFETTTQSRLAAGIKVLVKVTAEFHELYGFSLNITDIEPSYTIGELARQKLEIINRLKADGVFDMNKALTMPVLPQKIAVISSKTAAGFGDFQNQLSGNPYGYKFYPRLFPAVMQGDEAEQSIIAALDSIYSYENFFDVVVLIRGGGSQSDLNCFNSYWLASHICQFPLPVITGIGHEQDETIVDLVAHTRMKTPTAVAEFLIDLFRQVDMHINELSGDLYRAVQDNLKEENERLNKLLLVLSPAIHKLLTENTTKLKLLGINLRAGIKQKLIRESGTLSGIGIHLKTGIQQYFHNKHHVLEMLEKKNTYLDPFLILKRGYSITYFQGKALKKSDQISPDQVIETKLAEGTIKSKTL
jgi:exodeoxyribonuclease VII large subunit